MKRCPKCGIEKDESEYFNYFSKARNKIRVGNYCKPCKRVDAVPRAKAHYQQNKEEKLQYSRDYRANPENKEKLREQKNRFRKLYCEKLQPCYVAEQAARRLGATSEEIRQTPGLLQAYTLNMKLKRTLKELDNGKE